MRENIRKRFLKRVLPILIALTLTVGVSLTVAAEKGGVGEDLTQVVEGGDNVTAGGENSIPEEQNPPLSDETNEKGGGLSHNNGENTTKSEDYAENIFEELYAAIEENADKIFSVLAFVGTLVVGVGYKSGLLPLLRNALSGLKGAIDGVKADGETTKALTDGKLQEISASLEKIEDELSDMKWQYESYEEICRDRESLRLIISGQIDMLYSIFMTSALPQYQKDEVGERISLMREELKKYAPSEEN